MPQKKIAADVTAVSATRRRRPKKEEAGVNEVFAAIDWALSHSTLLGDMAVDLTIAGLETTRGQKSSKAKKSKPKEVPAFFPPSIRSLFGAEVDVLYTPSPVFGASNPVPVWVSGYRVLDPLRRETKYSESNRNAIIRGDLPLVVARKEEVDWNSRLLILPPHFVRVHEASAKEFHEVFGVKRI